MLQEISMQEFLKNWLINTENSLKPTCNKILNLCIKKTNMKKELKKWLIECKTTLRILHLKKLKVLTSDYEKLVIDTQIKDINIIIDKIKKILKEGENN